MKIQKILTVTPQEKKDLQTAMSPLEELINTGRDFCNDIGYCTDCPFHKIKAMYVLLIVLILIIS